MKDNTQMIVLALAGLAVYMIVKSKGTSTTAKTGTGSVSKFVNEIFGSNGQTFGNGWRYFDDGTAIDPQGNYYQNGQMIWSAPANGTTFV